MGSNTYVDDAWVALLAAIMSHQRSALVLQKRPLFAHVLSGGKREA